MFVSKAMAPLEVFDFVKQIDALSQLNNELNSAERLDLFKKVILTSNYFLKSLK